MKSVLFVISSLEYSGAARQLTLLASGLLRERARAGVCVLGATSPWGDDLRAAGVEVEALGRRRAFDVWPFLALRRRLHASPTDVVHVWGTAALRAVAMTKGFRDVWASAALPPLGAPGRIDAWLLRRVKRVVAFGEAEASRYRAAGAAERVHVVRPACGLRIADCGLRIEEHPRSVVVVGPLLAHKGVRDAVWATDILHYLYPDLELLLVGNPPPARVLDGLGHVGGVRLVGRCPDVTPYLERATVVWVPGRAGGVSAALEAMAAGKAVVAGRSPGIAEVIEDGVSGLLFEPGDKTGLARQTRSLLDDPDRRRILGEEARRRVTERFTPEQLVAQYVSLLDNA
jgi:glycosyltransferase involved in cell wall biosynthesis